MAQPKIYLRKLRDFGENLGDTFQFIRQELKPLLKSFTLISGVFMIGAAIVSGFYQMEIFTIFDKIDPDSPFRFTSVINGKYFLIIFLSILGMVAMNVVVASYMKLYDQHSVSPTVDEVWAEFRRYFLRAFILTLLVSIIVLIGIVLCIFPGLYFIIVLTPAVMIMVNEDTDISDTLSRCFTLIKEIFWQSVAIYLVAFLVYYFSAGVIGMVIGIFVGIATYLGTQKMESTIAVVTSIANVFGYFFYIIFFVSIGLHYYNLAERLDGFGMMRRIERFGTSTNTNNQIEEEF